MLASVGTLAVILLRGDEKSKLIGYSKFRLIEQSIQKRTNDEETVVVKESGRKGVGVEMMLKAVSQGSELGNKMIMADSTTGLLPNLLLRVKVRSGGRE